METKTCILSQGQNTLKTHKRLLPYSNELYYYLRHIGQYSDATGKECSESFCVVLCCVDCLMVVFLKKQTSTFICP